MSRSIFIFMHFLPPKTQFRKNDTNSILDQNKKTRYVIWSDLNRSEKCMKIKVQLVESIGSFPRNLKKLLFDDTVNDSKSQISPHLLIRNWKEKNNFFWIFFHRNMFIFRKFKFVPYYISKTHSFFSENKVILTYISFLPTYISMVSSWFRKGLSCIKSSF